MAKRGVKKKDHEKLSHANIKKVAALLTPSSDFQKPITKKDACGLLNISYNTARLTRIIEEWQEHEEFVARRKSQNRGKPASASEIQEAISSYLSGETVSDIAKSLFRSPAFIKSIIERVGVPTRLPKSERGKGTYTFPDSCMGDGDFEVGEVVWSAKYNGAAIVRRRLPDDPKYLGSVYQIYVMEDVMDSGPWFMVEKGGYNAYQPGYELGKLTHLTQHGVDLNKV